MRRALLDFEGTEVKKLMNVDNILLFYNI